MPFGLVAFFCFLFFFLSQRFHNAWFSQTLTYSKVVDHQIFYSVQHSHQVNNSGNTDKFVTSVQRGDANWGDGFLRRYSASLRSFLSWLSLKCKDTISCSSLETVTSNAAMLDKSSWACKKYKEFEKKQKKRAMMLKIIMPSSFYSEGTKMSKP